LNVESEKKKLIGEFNLTQLYLQHKDRVTFVEDNHEKMGDFDQQIFSSIVGVKVPY
jgi:hypothetical protein